MLPKFLSYLICYPFLVSQRRPVFVKTQSQILKWSCTQGMLQSYNYIRLSEAVVRRCSVKKVFLGISQIHRNTPVPETLI